MPAFTKSAGVWKPRKTLSARNSGVWKEVRRAYVRSGGVWKPVFKPPISVTNVANHFQTAETGNFTVPNANLGPVPSAVQRRYIVLAYGGYASLASVVTNTIAGVSTVAVGTVAQQGQCNSFIRVLEVPAGTSAAIALSLSSGQSAIGLSVFSVITGVEDVAFSHQKTVSDPLTFPAFNVLDGDVLIGTAQNRNGGAYTWSNLTENYDVDLLSADQFSSASRQIVADQAGLVVVADSVNALNDFAGSLMRVTYQ